MSSVLGTLASIGMAVGPPLVYADQAYSIIRKKDSSGFSHDVCGVVIVANVIRIFFWLGNRFETPLLVQSLLLILSQLILLSICLHYSHNESESYAPMSPLPGGHQEEASDYISQHPTTTSSASKGRPRPFDFWQWEGYGSYLEFLAGLIVVMGFLQIIFGRWMWYIDTLGFIALTIESTLPIPQFISNFKRKSTYGLRASTLAGWFGGDAFKTAYFFVRHSPIQFKVTAILTLCWDSAVCAQRIIYGTEPPRSALASAHENQDNQGLRVGL